MCFTFPSHIKTNRHETDWNAAKWMKLVHMNEINFCLVTVTGRPPTTVIQFCSNFVWNTSVVYCITPIESINWTAVHGKTLVVESRAHWTASIILSILSKSNTISNLIHLWVRRINAHTTRYSTIPRISKIIFTFCALKWCDMKLNPLKYN